MIVWLTGQPGSGKTTLARELEKRALVVVVDGDEIRNILGNPGYGEDGRRQNIKNAQNIAKFLDAKGFTVVVSLISPYRDQREELKSTHKVIEVYCHCDAVRGKEKFFVEGYQAPEVNFLDLNTELKSIEECVKEIEGAMK